MNITSVDELLTTTGLVFPPVFIYLKLSFKVILFWLCLLKYLMLPIETFDWFSKRFCISVNATYYVWEVSPSSYKY